MLTLLARKQRGFTMLEVVIAMAVGAIGIVAFAGLQIKSLEISEESRERATAAYIASEMVERMSMNTQDFSAAQIYRGQIGSFWDDAPEEFGALVIPDLCGGVCDPETRAGLDIREVKRMARALLPNGDINQYLCGTGNDFNCIVVAWEDADPNNCSLQADGAGLEDCFVMQVKLW